MLILFVEGFYWNSKIMLAPLNKSEVECKSIDRSIELLEQLELSNESELGACNEEKIITLLDLIIRV